MQFPDQPFVRPAVLAYSRIVEAVRLYFLAKKNDCPCSIVISGGDAPRTGVTEAEDYRAEMLRLGVEDSDIVPEGRSLNTFQNAEFIEEILRGQPFDKLFLVTSVKFQQRYEKRHGIVATDSESGCDSNWTQNNVSASRWE